MSKRIRVICLFLSIGIILYKSGKNYLSMFAMRKKMQKVMAVVLILALSMVIFNTSCTRKIGEDSIPFLSFGLLTDKEAESKSIYLNYWDVKNGKVHLSKTPFYECYSNAFAFPVFWSGGNTLYFNHKIKQVSKNIRIEIPLTAEFSALESKIKIFSYFELEKKEVSEYILPPNVFPEDIFHNNTINTSIVFPQEDSIVVPQGDISYLIFTYPSLNPKDKQDVLTKLFIVSIENNEAKPIPIQTNQIYSLSTLSFPFKQGYAIVNGKLLLGGYIVKDGSYNRKWVVLSVNLADGKLDVLISHNSSLGVFKQYVIASGYLWKNNEYQTEIVGVSCTAYENNNPISELRILKGSPSKIEVYKDGVLTDEITIERFNMNVFFPNFASNEK